MTSLEGVVNNINSKASNSLDRQNTRLNLRNLFWMSVKTERVKKKPTAPTKTRTEKTDLSSSNSEDKTLELADCEVTAQWQLWQSDFFHPPHPWSKCLTRAGTSVESIQTRGKMKRASQRSEEIIYTSAVQQKYNVSHIKR